MVIKGTLSYCFNQYNEAGREKLIYEDLSLEISLVLYPFTLYTTSLFLVCMVIIDVPLPNKETWTAVIIYNLCHSLVAHFL